MRVLVFGDSITYDTSLQADNWPRYLYREYKTKIASSGYDAHLPEIYNLGIAGDLAAGVARRIEAEIPVRRWKDAEVAVVIFIGINDAQIEDGQAYSTPEKFRETLEEILNKSSKYTERILFIGLPAVDESRSNPAQWDKRISFNNRWVKLFDDQIRDISKQNNLAYVSLYEKFLQHPEFLLDGVHPNEEGQKFIAETVKPAIEDLVK